MADRVSEAELQLLAALWERAPQSATDLADSVGSANGWTLATVKTLIARLVQKGAVASEADGRRFLYTPLLARDAVMAQESERLIDRLLGGRVSPLVAHLAAREALSDDDIAEIEDIIRRLKP
jgi:BlaI family transcriptional regulator, penicillinase repressor